jgi:quercetin dioxygenase-like cupin family protein
MVRRLRLSPGESMPWHRDPFHRVAVVPGGDVLLIEYRDGGDSHRVEISPGQVDWEKPSEPVHRAGECRQAAL